MMKIDNNFKLNFNFLELEVIEMLDFKDYPILTLEKNKLGHYYVSYLVDYLENFENRIAIAISPERLANLKSGELSLHDAFQRAEDNSIYFLRYDMINGTLLETYLYPLQDFINPIPLDYRFQYLISERKPELDKKEFIATSKKKERILLDLYVKSQSLINNIKPWAIYKILNPVVEIIKKSLGIDARLLDKHFAFSNLRQSSLGISIEIDYEKSLFLDLPEYDKTNKIIDLFNAIKKEDFDELIKFSKDQSFIHSYSIILNNIIKNNAIFTAAMVNPLTNEIKESMINIEKAKSVKKIINENYDEIIDDIQIEGYFLEININKKEPSFSVYSQDEEYIIKGKIDINLIEKLTHDKINIGKDQYLFDVHVIYVTETKYKKYETKRFLMNYLPKSNINTSPNSV